MHEKPVTLPINQIEVNPHQPRKDFSYLGLSKLKESIQAHGLIHPVVVRRVGEGYQLIAGERRLRACKMLGWTEIPVVFRLAEETDSALLSLIENLQRSDLNALEEAQAYQELLVHHHLNQEEVAAAVGKARSTVANTLRLLELPSPIREMLREGEITPGHAKSLLSLKEEPGKMLRLAQDIKSKGLSVREAELLVASHLGGPLAHQSQPKPSVPFEKELLKFIHRRLGSKATLTKTQGGWLITPPPEENGVTGI